MRQKSGATESTSERIVKNIRRATRKQYSAEEKIRIVLDGLRGEHSIAELCRREGIVRIAQTCFWRSGGLAPISFPLFRYPPGRGQRKIGVVLHGRSPLVAEEDDLAVRAGRP
jgi:hypothetical protein